MSAFPILMLLLIVVAFWFLVLRPARQRQREQASLLDQLRVGSRVMTTAGLFGTVVAINGDRISLRIADGVVVEYLNLAIAKLDEPVSSPPVPLSGDDESVVVADAPGDSLNSGKSST